MPVAGRIRDEDIALVREKSAIDEVVGEYLQLRNAGGGSLKGLCPFHDEKTPSFNVTPARGLWYCFSCAEGGDVIKFVQKIDSLTFVEAVERLAGRAGIDLRYEQGGQVPGREHSLRRRLIEAHKAAAEFYAERLLAPAATPAREFLDQRGFTLADAERFGVGYAPAEWEALTRHLRGRGFTDDELLAGGLAIQGQRGPRDRFRGRLIWPIRDLTGDVIAFGARKLNPDEEGAKYLNTPDTPLFHKSSVLYGADLAKREIAQRRQAVIVEGYTDVMACHLAGVPTAVATCGTSFGADHVKILRRLLMDADWQVAEVIFTFDGDAAGQKAALRAFGLEEQFATQTYVAVQPDGLDPCDLRDRARRRGRPRPGRPAPAGLRVRRAHRAGPARPGQQRGPAGRAGRGGARRGPDQGPGAARAVRGQPGPLARPAGRGVRAGPDPRARRGRRAGPGRAGQPGGPPRGAGRRGRRAVPRPAAVPPRRAPRHTVTTPAIRWSGWSARCSSWPCSARPCAGRPSTPWRAGTSPCPCTGRCGS